MEAATGDVLCQHRVAGLLLELHLSFNPLIRNTLKWSKKTLKVLQQKRLRVSDHFRAYTINGLTLQNSLLFEMTYHITHCVKGVQIRSFFWSVFSRIRTECGEIRSIWILFTQ